MSESVTLEVCKRFAASMLRSGTTRRSPLAVALSGGPDSTALALLCAWWTGTGAMSYPLLLNISFHSFPPFPSPHGPFHLSPLPRQPSP